MAKRSQSPILAAAGQGADPWPRTQSITTGPGRPRPDSMDTSPQGSVHSGTRAGSGSDTIACPAEQTRETGTPTGRRGHALLTGCAWKRQARPQAAGQALQRLLQGWLRSTLKGRRENPGEKARGSRSFSTEWALQHKFHLLNRKAAENKTPLYKDREQRMYTWAHSNTLRLRNSPGKGVAQGSAAREEQRLRAQPWARRGGQAVLRTPREEGACKHRGLLSDQAALRAPREAATRGQKGSAHAPGQEPPSQPPAATAALSPTPTKGAPSRGAWLPGPSGGGAAHPASPAPSRGAPAPRPPACFQLAHRLVSGVTGVRTQPERLRATRRRWGLQESELRAHKSQSSEGGLSPRKRHRCKRRGNAVSKRMLEVP